MPILDRPLPLALALVVSLLCVPAFAPPAADAAAPAGTKVLVLPYQAIYRSVTQPKLDSATQLLFKELEQKEGLSIIRGAVGAPSANAVTLDPARAAVTAAQKAEAERRIHDAVAEWKKAITAYEANAGALEQIDEYVEAHHRLARAVLMTGDDKAGQTAIDAAARLAPNYPLLPSEYSRLYRRWFAEAAQVAIKEVPGSVMVMSPLPGAQVFLDGRPMEVAPVLLERVVPGRHLVVAQVAGVPAWASTVTVAPKQKVEVRASFSGTLGGSAVGKVTDAIAENGIPRPAVEAAAAAGKEAGASYVVFGGMAKDDDKFRVHTFLVDTKGAKIAPLEGVSFDLELLTAETDVLKIANAASDAISKFPGGTPQHIAQIEKRIKAQSTVTKVDASPDLVSSAHPAASKKVRGPREVFKPLKAGTVEIKDEKEPKE